MFPGVTMHTHHLLVPERELMTTQGSNCTRVQFGEAIFFSTVVTNRSIGEGLQRAGMTPDLEAKPLEGAAVCAS